MNSNSVVFDRGLILERPAIGRLNAGDRLVLTLLSVGLIAGLVAYISYDVVARQQLRPGEFVAAAVVKPPLYYAAHSAEIVLLTVAGLLALASANLRQMEHGITLRFMAFVGAAMLMSLRGFAPADFLSTKVVDGTGPFPMILSLLIFIGAKRSNWVILYKVFFAQAAIFCGFGLFRMTALQTFTRQEGVANLAFSLNALLWPAAWIMFRSYPPGSIASRVKLIPMVVFGLASLFTQTRLNFMMVLAAFALYAFIQRKRRAPQAMLWIGMAALAVWIALFTGIFLRSSRGLDRLEDVTSAFAERIDEDTRTEQVTAFFDSVAPGELVLGRGSFATWDWDGYDWRGGTDIGYLSLLFFGGLPLLLTYIAVHVKPCISTLLARTPDWRLAGAGVGVLWAIRMFSSSYPGTSLDYYCVLFCIGAAISRDVEA